MLYWDFDFTLTYLTAVSLVPASDNNSSSELVSVVVAQLFEDVSDRLHKGLLPHLHPGHTQNKNLKLNLKLLPFFIQMIPAEFSLQIFISSNHLSAWVEQAKEFECLFDSTYSTRNCSLDCDTEWRNVMSWDKKKHLGRNWWKRKKKQARYLILACIVDLSKGNKILSHL